MKYPKFLPEKGTIGFVAPSFGCVVEPYRTAFLNAQKKFQTFGYKLDLGPNCYEAKGIGISNTPETCGEELTDYYSSEKNDILISCGGGELMCETMNHVDFEKIKKAAPKWYMGFSDNTNMTFLLATICDTASIYGPCAAAFGMEPWHQSLTDAMDILSGKKNVIKGYECWEKEGLKDEENPLVPYNVTEPRDMVIYSGNVVEESSSIIWKENETELYKAGKNQDLSITMQGRLLGGCVDCLVNLLGTSFDHVEEFNEKYKEDGIIWYLECCDLNVMGIRRAMWQMKNAGWFKYTKGFLIGRPLCFGQNMMGLDQYHAVIDILKDFNVSIIMDVDLGHLPPMMPIINGSYGTVKVKGNDIEVTMDLI